ncbi:beta-ketoacyl synthase N-terminal-like domain-containing protein [Paraclostridium bifermentans]|uniref:beta-ketoacyl synthase N-terminal-like domain-containing protein n=1 Tax=Paraclostridium bifermentans TaxID=1490 RepID=UPI00290F42EF|nr:beta-ketoacyl synthase N-terminal-like domain-containing protein [Paraclostridium bifermentans]MDU3338025.1 beta-ketoacyl synthase N-terminal-like domain-containing protein [Paraclostridium bifermentans]
MKNENSLVEYSLNDFIDKKDDYRSLCINNALSINELYMYVYLYLLTNILNEELMGITINKENDIVVYCLNKNRMVNYQENTMNISIDESQIKVFEKETYEEVICIDVKIKNQKILYTYKSNKLDELRIRQLHSYFNKLLNNWVIECEETIENINYLSESDIGRIVQISKGNENRYSENQSIFDIFYRQYTLNKNKIVFTEYIDGQKVEYTYDMIFTKSISLYNQILELNLENNSIIGVYLDRGVNVLISLLAILKSGHIYMPIDNSFPEEYITEMIKDAKPKAIISEADLFSENIFIDINCLGDTSCTYNDCINNSFDIDSSCAILYTSGSTGKPKGVIINQRQILNRFYWMIKNYKISVKEVFGQRCALSTIPSLWDMLAGVLLGKSTIIVPENILRNPKQFVDFIEDNEITFITLIPSILHLMTKVSKAKEKLSCIKNVITLGEKFTVHDYEICRLILSKAIIINDYGSTETNTLLVNNFYPEDINKKIAGMRPIDNIGAYILNENNQLCGFYTTGELAVYGDCIFNGYLNLLDMTESKKQVVSINGTNQTVFKTGDLAYLNEDGSINLLERKDKVFKLHGKRIDLTGINTLIQRLDIVDESCTLGYNKNGENSIGAILKLNKKISLKEIKKIIYEDLSKKVPEYMVPVNIKIVDTIPLLPNGKRNMKTIERQLFENDEKLNYKQFMNKISEILKIKIKDDDINTEFKYLGMDSLRAMEFIDELQKVVGKKLDISILYEYPSIKLLFDFLFNDETNENKIKPQDVINENNEYAIIGMSGLFPNADSIEEYWETLVRAKCVTDEIPKNRLKIDEIYDSNPNIQWKTYSKWGGFFKNIDNLDLDYFHLYPGEIECMSIHQKLAIIESYRTLENAGYSPDNPKLKDTGVFIGGGKYDVYSDKNTADSVIGNENSLIAERISYLNDFMGPSIMIDTACSSSLVALHQACLSLKNRDCYAALVGGINILDNEGFYLKTSRLNVFSNDGKTKTFSNEANGFVPGECIAFIMIKRLDDAIKDQDNILTVIKGSSINQDGRTNGITAPSGKAQKLLLEKLYTEKNIDINSIDYIETHGTGTKIGDVIEINALSKVFSNRKNSCYIGSVKPNVGHLIHSAGIASLIKGVLMIQNRTFIASINQYPLNEKIDWDNIPFEILTQNKEYNSTKPMRIGISSFGIGGTNSHCVIEEYVSASLPQKVDGSQNEYISFPLFAPTPNALENYIETFYQWFSKNINLNLEDISNTLVFGRKRRSSGIIVLARNNKELLDLLESYTSKNMDRYFHSKINNYDIYISYDASSQMEEINKKIESYLLDSEERVPSYKKVPIISSYDYLNQSDEKIENKSNTFIDTLIKYLGVSNNEVDKSLTLEEIGMDSLKIMGFKDELNRLFSKDISISKLYDYTILEIEELLANKNDSSEANTNIIKEYLNGTINFSTITNEEVEQLYNYLNNEVDRQNERLSNIN